MAPNAVTTGHCQIQLRPRGAVTPLPLVDPGQSSDLGCGGEAPGSPIASAFYNTNYYSYYYYYGRALARTDLTILFHVLLSMAAVLISCMLSRCVSLFRVLKKVVAFLPLLVLPMVGCQIKRCDAISSGCLRQCLAILNLLSAIFLLTFCRFL